MRDTLWQWMQEYKGVLLLLSLLLIAYVIRNARDNTPSSADMSGESDAGEMEQFASVVLKSAYSDGSMSIEKLDANDIEAEQGVIRIYGSPDLTEVRLEAHQFILATGTPDPRIKHADTPQVVTLTYHDVCVARLELHGVDLSYLYLSADVSGQAPDGSDVYIFTGSDIKINVLEPDTTGT